jgi:mono/diheme cytochrome c family protein
MRPVIRRILPWAVATVAIASVGVIWFIRGPDPMAFIDGSKVVLAAYEAGDPTGVPGSLAKASLIERGRYLADAADCTACHTAQGGKEYAGGLGIRLPFGTLYSTNITPDKETGIGNYSDQEFLDAVQRGIRRDVARLYPAMPFTSYTYITDADVLAIKAYLFSLPPVRAVTATKTLFFPFNQRWAMGFWAALFARGSRFEPTGMEQGRISGGSACPLRRVPYPAKHCNGVR